MSSTTEKRFVNLRKRLDQLGYRQTLGVESVPLVEKLFRDLVHTTENLRDAKLTVEKPVKESQTVDDLLEQYKTENAQLVRESNELHIELLKLREDKDRVTRDLKAHIIKLEHETSDLKFLNNQYVHKVRCLERDSKTKAERIQQLQEKNLQAVVQTPGGKKHSIPFRRQRMQIDEPTPPPSTSAYPVSQPDDPYIADLLQLADGRINELQDVVEKFKLDLENSHESIQHLTAKVEERDKEIERLNHALHGGRPHNVVSMEAQNMSNEKLISRLNLQIEYLQEANRTLEQKVEGLQQKKSNGYSQVVSHSLKNLELCDELTHRDEITMPHEPANEQELESLQAELQKNNVEIERQRRIIEDLEANVAKLREQSDIDTGKEQHQSHLVDLKEQTEKMERLVKFLEEEKSRLQDKMEKMMAAEKSMVLELETMRAKHGVCGRERSPSRLDAFVKSLEEERDYYRREVQVYKWAIGPSLGSSRSPVRGRSPGSKVLRGGVVDAEMYSIVKERDELKAALLDLEEHTEDVQNSVKALTAERDHLKVLFQQAQEDLKCPRSPDTSGDLTILKEELRRAELKVLELTTERDTMGERLQTVVTDQQEEERQIVDLENAIKRLERERLDLQLQVSLLKENREAVEQELNVRSAVAVQNAEDAAQRRAEANTFRLLQEQMEQSLSEVQHTLSAKINELHEAHQQNEKLARTIEEMTQQVSRNKQDTSVFQMSMAALDREKDALQDEVDQMTEKVVALEEELSKKQRNLEDIRLTVTSMDKSLAQLQGALHSREREIASLRKQLDSSQEELAELKLDKEISVKDNTRLQDDLTTMTRENQAVHADMEQALHEKEEMTMRYHTFVSDVSRIEKLLAEKEQENHNLMELFRVSKSEVEEQKQKLQKAEGLNSSIRHELLTLDSECRHLRETVSKQAKEMKQHTQALQAYEAQVSSLVHGMSQLEEKLHNAQENRASLLADLASVKELCVKLDSGKELIARQLTTKNMELERVMAELQDVRSKEEVMKKKLTSETVNVRKLETLLSTNRQKEFETHLTATEKESELKVLRDKLTRAENKTAVHAREVSNLRGKVSQLQTEMDLLKRQLTSERFERERAVQEMRKQGLTFTSTLPTSPHASSSEHISLRSLDLSTDKLLFQTM